MIYLFNSGFCNEYAINVLNTLHLPDGANNLYRYSIESGHNFVENKLKSENHQGEDVMIIFIDRYAEGGFKYHPIRKGKLISSETDQEKMYFTVQLLEQYAVRNIETFNEYFVKKFFKLVPCINAEKNPELHGSGYFAFVEEDCSREFSSVGDSWITNAKRLSEVKIFKESFTIFTKASFTGNKNVTSKKIEDKNKFLLKRNETYGITINYYFRELLISDASFAEIELVEKSRCFTTTSSKKTIGNKAGKLEYELVTQKIPEQKHENIEFSLSNSSNTDERKIFFTDALIDIAIVNNKKIWAEIITYAILIGISQWLLALDPVAMHAELSAPNLTLSISDKISLWIANGLLDFKYFYPILFRAGNVGLTILMFFRFGKKVI